MLIPERRTVELILDLAEVLNCLEISSRDLPNRWEQVVVCDDPDRPREHPLREFLADAQLVGVEYSPTRRALILTVKHPRFHPNEATSTTPSCLCSVRPRKDA